MRRALAALLVLAAPTAGALDALPAEWGALDAALVVRADGAARVDAEPRVVVEGLGPTPVHAEARGPWRGMDGVIELRLHRERADERVQVEVVDAAGAGMLFEWPAQATVPSAGWLVVACAVGLATLARTKTFRR